MYPQLTVGALVDGVLQGRGRGQGAREARVLDVRAVLGHGRPRRRGHEDAADAEAGRRKKDPTEFFTTFRASKYAYKFYIVQSCQVTCQGSIIARSLAGKC